MIVIVIIIVILYFLIKFRHHSRSNFDSGMIPRKIWTFWDSEPIPEFIEKCINTWKTENPDIPITILTKNNLAEYVSESEADAIFNWKYNNLAQKLSDLVRLSILSKYGGLWLDASIVCYSPFDWVFDDGAHCIMFSIPEISAEPVLESWFIACTPGNTFVSRWNEEFRKADQFESMEKYVEYLNVDKNGIEHVDYLLVYFTARKILRELPNDVKIMNASEGPYIYHVNGGVTTLCAKKPEKFIKLRKEDRAAVKEAGDEVEKCVFDKHTGVTVKSPAVSEHQKLSEND